MELLERYLLQIGRYLHAKDREDTLNELRSLLLENYDNEKNDSVSEKDAMYQVIKNFGAPQDIAFQYRNDQPLIKKELEPFLYLIMKIVSIALPSGIVLSNIVGYIFNEANPSLMNLMLDIAYSIPSILTTLLSTLALLYIGAIVISRYVGDNVNFKIEEFDPNFLPYIPKNAFKVSIGSVVFEIIASVVFLYLINLEPGLIAVYADGVKEPLLNSNFEKILPLMNLSIFIGLGLNIFHLIRRRKNLISTTIEYMKTIFGGIIFILLARGDIFNQIIIDGNDLGFITTMFTIGMIIGAIAAFIGGTVTYVKVLFSDPKEKGKL